MEYRFYQRPRFWYVTSTVALILNIAQAVKFQEHLLNVGVGALGIFVWSWILVTWIDIARMRREIERLRGE
jgi:hypothetical protein